MKTMMAKLEEFTSEYSGVVEQKIPLSVTYYYLHIFILLHVLNVHRYGTKDELKVFMAKGFTGPKVMKNGMPDFLFFSTIV
ncbi:hypothetical protein GUJ93_ZPchr0012g20562 [Zizania palustris]|uniref:Uncharacterized protein n=1 Tax=Zizania palustris TaxID=103762 RepID=A0A8J5WMS9_ZIZPA|nr:hypothetical protein GUJ93_ZPchr0012g20562 [Zizania palustris]